MSESHNVKLTLCPLQEDDVQEVLKSGREIIIKTLPASDLLTYYANRINFLNEEDEYNTESNIPKWFTIIRSSIRKALREMNYLVDFLSIAQIKPIRNVPNIRSYFAYDLVADKLRLNSKEPSTCSWIVKRYKLLWSGKNLVRKSYLNLKSEPTEQHCFHTELLKLRKRWRVRLNGQKLIGDLSYLSVGSDCPINGKFEVLKKFCDDDHYKEDAEKYNSASPLRVVVSPGLRGYASIFISITNLSDSKKSKIGKSCSLTCFDIVQNSLSNANDPAWHRQLCDAQNVLFCKEMFMVLAREAMQYKSRGMIAPFVVIDDMISTLIFPDTKIVVKLVLSSEKITRQDNDDREFFSLKFVLTQLLRAYHLRNSYVCRPYPICAVLGLHSAVRFGAVAGYSKQTLDYIAKETSVPLAESFLKMAQHFVVRKRLSEVIDTLAQKLNDPVILSHWSVASSIYHSNVKLYLFNHDVEDAFVSGVDFTVYPTEVKSVDNKEGTVSYLSTDKASLSRYILSVICTHQILVVGLMPYPPGWYLTYCPIRNDSVTAQMVCNCSVLIKSSSSDKSISVRCCVDFEGNLNYEVKIHFENFSSDHLINSKSKFESNSDETLDFKRKWVEVDMKNCPGKTFINKIETVLACYGD